MDSFVRIDPPRRLLMRNAALEALKSTGPGCTPGPISTELKERQCFALAFAPGRSRDRELQSTIPHCNKADHVSTPIVVTVLSLVFRIALAIHLYLKLMR